MLEFGRCSGWTWAPSGKVGEREAEGGARLGLEDLDQGAGPLRLDPLVQLALALAGETESRDGQ